MGSIMSFEKANECIIDYDLGQLLRSPSEHTTRCVIGGRILIERLHGGVIPISLPQGTYFALSNHQMPRRLKSTNGLLRHISTNFEAIEGEIREGINRGRGPPVDVGPSLLLATMRTDSSTTIKSVAVENLTPDDHIVLLMGPPGSGKTTFIELAASTKFTQKSTTDISAFRVSVSKFSNSNIVLVDTPAFNDTDMTDVEVLTMLSDWLNYTYQRDIRLTGSIYFHRISDAAIEGTQLRNWRAFEKICGESFNKVVLATTMWDDVEDGVGYNREKELEDSWSANVVGGLHMKRFLRDRPSAADVLSPILENVTKRPLRLQREIADLNMTLKQTTAARALFLQLEALLRECKQNLLTIRDDLNNPSLNRQELRDLEEKYAETSFLLERVTAALTDLKTAPTERLERFALMAGLGPTLRFMGFKLGKRPEPEGEAPYLESDSVEDIMPAAAHYARLRRRRGRVLQEGGDGRTG